MASANAGELVRLKHPLENSRHLTTHVVRAIIDVEDRILVLKLPLRKDDSRIFELPGGKIEPGETPLAALVREIDEELGSANRISSILEYRGSVDYTNDGLPKRQSFFHIEMESPVIVKINSAEHVGYLWLPRASALDQVMKRSAIAIADHWNRAA